jgi:DNA-binding transcriptional LysR family regulator
VEIDDIAGIVALVGQGLGVALLPVVDGSPPPVAPIRMVPLSGPAFYREIGILQPQESMPAAICLAECLMATQQ